MYMLIGDSGTVIFEKTGTITGESAKMSTTVTSNAVEGGENIGDHAVLDPVQFGISGVVSDGIQYTRLEAMWRNRDLITYRGIEAYNNLLITSLQRVRSTDNASGYAFQIELKQIRIVSSAMAASSGTMSQQDAETVRSDEADVGTRQTLQNGVVPLSSSYESGGKSFDDKTVNTAIATGRTNPSYAGYRTAS